MREILLDDFFSQISWQTRSYKVVHEIYTNKAIRNFHVIQPKGKRMMTSKNHPRKWANKSCKVATKKIARKNVITCCFGHILDKKRRGTLLWGPKKSSDPLHTLYKVLFSTNQILYWRTSSHHSPHLEWLFCMDMAF